VEGVEKERERISRELHDDIGSRLGSLKRFLPAPHNPQLEKQIDILYDDVRALSLKIAGLQQNILDFVYDTQEKEGRARVAVEQKTPTTDYLLPLTLLPLT
jgi:Histidine kinase